MFNFNKVFSLIFLSLFLFSFVSADDINYDLTITNYSVDGNLQYSNITFTIDYNNIGTMDYNADFNVIYSINDTNPYNVTNMDSSQDTFIWFADVNGIIPIKICIDVNDLNNLNNCTADFNIIVFSIDMNIDLNTDLNAYSLDFANDVNYKDTLKIDFNFNNIGAYDLNADFNVVFKVDSNVVNIQNFSDLNINDFNFATYNWEANKVGNVNIEACIDYATDINMENNCLSKNVNVKAVDLEAVELELSSTSVNSGAKLTATLTYGNVGTLDLDKQYNIKFYSDNKSISNCNFNLTTNVAKGTQKTKACEFNAPSVTSNKNYVIKALITYEKDSNNRNNEVTKKLTVKKPVETSTRESSIEDNPKVDLKAISLDFSDNITLNEKLDITFVFKNIGTSKATDSYNVIINAKLDKEVKNICSKLYTEGLAKNSSKEFVCSWTPSKVGEYTITADVDYPYEITYNNNTLTKKLKVITKVVTLPTKKEPEVLLKDSKEIIKKDFNVSSNALNFLEDVNVKRDFNVVKNDDNSFTTHVKLTLTTNKDSVLENYFYYEYLPDENKYLKFKIDLNNTKTLEYDLNYEVSKDMQSKFYGALFSKDVLSTPKPIYNSDKGSFLYYVAMIVLGIIIIVLVVLLISKIIQSRNKFNPYKKHKKVVRVEEKHHWLGYGVDDAPKVKYKSGKFKYKEPKKTAVYKGRK